MSGAFIIFAVATVTAYLALIYFAPEGYETSSGFHYGREPLDDSDHDLPESAEGLLPDDMSEDDWLRWMNGEVVVHANPNMSGVER